MRKKFKILQPKYFDKFCCIDSKCEDSCCNRDWRIDIDKKNYELFQKLPDPEWRQFFRRNITINKNGNADNECYASINLDANNRCPFLTKDNYCLIELRWGKSCLPLVCQTFPRSYNVINGMLEKSLNLSCPEAARVVLGNPDFLQFAETEEYFYIHNTLSNILDTDNVDFPYEPQRYFWELRIFIISTLQNRKYALWERLVILGYFLDNLIASLNNGKAEMVPDLYIKELINSYNIWLEQKEFEKLLQNIPNEITIEVKLIKKLKWLTDKTGSIWFAECFTDALCGFGSLQNLEERQIGVIYAESYYDYYRPLLSEHEYILENYLVNYVFRELFPFDADRNIFDNYIYLVINYILIKIFLVGMAGFYKEKFNVGHVIKLISSFSHVAEQDPDYLISIFNFLENNKLTGLADIAILIKN